MPNKNQVNRLPDVSELPPIQGFEGGTDENVMGVNPNLGDAAGAAWKLAKEKFSGAGKLVNDMTARKMSEGSIMLVPPTEANKQLAPYGQRINRPVSQNELNFLKAKGQQLQAYERTIASYKDTQTPQLAQSILLGGTMLAGSFDIFDALSSVIIPEGAIASKIPLLNKYYQCNNIYPIL